MSRNRAAFVGALIMVALYVLLTGCTAPTQPDVVSCHPQVIQTPQGPWVTGQQTCESLNPRTGQGHAVTP